MTGFHVVPTSGFDQPTFVASGSNYDAIVRRLSPTPGQLFGFPEQLPDLRRASKKSALAERRGWDAYPFPASYS